MKSCFKGVDQTLSTRRRKLIVPVGSEAAIGMEVLADPIKGEGGPCEVLLG